MEGFEGEEGHTDGQERGGEGVEWTFRERELSDRDEDVF